MLIEVIFLIILSLLVILILVAFIGCIAFNLIFKSDNKPLSIKKGAIKSNSEVMLPNWISDLKVKKIVAYDGTELNGYYLYKSEEFPWIIFIHGYRGRASNMIKYIQYFVQRKVNVLSIDLRGHGLSQGKYITLGALDKDDLNMWIEWINEISKATRIILFGTSMGAATSLMCSAKYAPKISGLILDSCPSNMNIIIRRIIRHKLGMFHHIILPVVNIMADKFIGIDFNSVSPINYLSQKSVPALFIHGKNDGFVPLKLSNELYENYPGYHRLITIDNAEHVHSVDVEPELYWNAVDCFLEQIGVEV